MRILQVVHHLPEQRLAGVELYTSQLASALALHHDVAVVAPARETQSPTSENPFAVFGVTGADTGAGLAPQYNGSTGEFDAVLERFAPDVVHVQHLERHSVRVLERCARAGVPVVFTVHDYWLTCAAGGQRFHPRWGSCPLLEATRCGRCVAHLHGPAQRAREVVRRFGGGSSSESPEAAFPDASPFARTRARFASALRSPWFGNAKRGEDAIEARWRAIRTQLPNVKHWLVPSPHLIDDLCKFGVPRDSIEVSPYGIDLRRFVRRPPARLVQRFGFLGSLVRHKGLHHLIESLPDQCELWVGGASGHDLPFDALLRRRARGRRVRFLGPLSPGEIPGFFGAIDCLVVPSLWRENSPFVIHEAFASGVPVVASRRGGVPHLLAAGGGVLYEPDRRHELPEILHAFATQSEAMAQQCGSPPEVLGIEEHARAITEVYGRLSEPAR